MSMSMSLRLWANYVILISQFFFTFFLYVRTSTHTCKSNNLALTCEYVITSMSALRPLFIGTTCQPYRFIHENLVRPPPWNFALRHVSFFDLEPLEILFVGSFSKIVCVGFMGLSYAMHTCVGSKYTYLIPTPIVKRSYPSFLYVKDFEIACYLTTHHHKIWYHLLGRQFSLVLINTVNYSDISFFWEN